MLKNSLPGVRGVAKEKGKGGVGMCGGESNMKIRMKGEAYRVIDIVRRKSHTLQSLVRQRKDRKLSALNVPRGKTENKREEKEAHRDAPGNNSQRKKRPQGSVGGKKSKYIVFTEIANEKRKTTKD